MNGVSELAQRLEAKGRNLADSFKNAVHYPVDMLVGADYYYNFITPKEQDEGVIIIPSNP